MSWFALRDLQPLVPLLFRPLLEGEVRFHIPEHAAIPLYPPFEWLCICMIRKSIYI